MKSFVLNKSAVVEVSMDCVVFYPISPISCLYFDSAGDGTESDALLNEWGHNTIMLVRKFCAVLQPTNFGELHNPHTNLGCLAGANCHCGYRTAVKNLLN